MEGSSGGAGSREQEQEASAVRQRGQEEPGASPWSNLERTVMSELSHAPPNLMCSEEEATRREEEMDVSMYEATDATLSLPVNKRRIDRRRAVAKYRRSAAGRDIQAEAFQRPLPALLDTTRYLLTLFMRETGLGCKQPRVGGSTHDAYTFVEDRLRAVRQSLVVQHMSHKEDAILILEATARFYILSGHLLQNASVLEQPQPFDSHLLQSQLNGVMASLTEQHQAGKGSIDEFSCYRMLLSLGQAVRGDHHSGSAAATLGLCCSQSAAGVGSLSQLLRSIVVSYEGGALDSPRMTFALRCVTSCLQGNYRQFLQGLKEATPLENCLLTTIAESTRVHCLLCVNKGFGKGEKVPIEDMRRLLSLGSVTVAESFCSGYSLLPVDGAVLMKIGPVQRQHESCPQSHDIMLERLELIA